MRPSSPTSRATGSSPASASPSPSTTRPTLDSFDDRDEVVTQFDGLVTQIADFQERLYAEEKRSLLIVLQGIDAAGKDGTVKHVLRGTNPSGVRVYSFTPADERGGRARLPLALPPRDAGRRHDPRLQPLALRGRAGRAGEGPRARGAVALALRLDQRLRAHARARGDDDPQVLPPHLARAPAGEVPRAPGAAPTSTGSGRTTTSRSASTGTSTSGPTRTRSTRRARHGRRGTSSPPTTAGSATTSSRACSPPCWGR